MHLVNLDASMIPLVLGLCARCDWNWEPYLHLCWREHMSKCPNNMYLNYTHPRVSCDHCECYILDVRYHNMKMLYHLMKWYPVQVFETTNKFYEERD